MFSPCEYIITQEREKVKFLFCETKFLFRGTKILFRGTKKPGPAGLFGAFVQNTETGGYGCIYFVQFPILQFRRCCGIL